MKTEMVCELKAKNIVSVVNPDRTLREKDSTYDLNVEDDDTTAVLCEENVDQQICAAGTAYSEHSNPKDSQ